MIVEFLIYLGTFYRMLKKSAGVLKWKNIMGLMDSAQALIEQDNPEPGQGRRPLIYMTYIIILSPIIVLVAISTGFATAELFMDICSTNGSGSMTLVYSTVAGFILFHGGKILKGNFPNPIWAMVTVLTLFNISWHVKCVMHWIL